jgi:hypothetical protein
VYLVLDADGVAVGITGLFMPGGDVERDKLALRWHGIVLEYRNKGYSKQAFEAVCGEARFAFPQARDLIKIMPLADETKGRKLIAYFGSLSFTLDGAPKDVCEFSASAALPPESGQWQAMRFALRVARQERIHWCDNGIVD